MRHALVMLALAIRRASTLLPPAAPTLRSARFATDASRALEQRFDAALKDDCGVRANDTVVAAVSGGIDSTCLLHLLAGRVQSEGRDLRPPPARRRVDGGRGLRAATGGALRFGMRHAPSGRAARAPPINSAGGAGRSLRQKGDHVATAHHADDEAELFLLRLAGRAPGRKLLKVCACGSRPSSGLY